MVTIKRMDKAIRQLVQAIHDSPPRIVQVTAGAGTQALSDLLGVAGATRTLLEALVPYSQAAFDDFLGQSPPQYVAARTANLMAGRAYTRARWLETEALPSVGLACTATIITDRPKRGEHRAHIATWQAACLNHYTIYLEKGARDRTGEEDVVSRIMLNALAQAMGLEMRLPVPLTANDHLTTETSDFMATAVQLTHHNIPYFCVMEDGRIHTNHVNPPALLAGAFNPLHDGHIDLRNLAGKLLGEPVAFECTAVNVDKPPLTPETITQRIAQFAGRYPVYVTTAPTYIEKARLFPNTVFVVGYDTAERILMPRYYDNSYQNMLAALTEIRDLGCSFLVAGRADKRGFFHDRRDLAIPAGFETLFRGIPPEKFRKDISSTYLRATGQRGSR
ncbi:MAG TPA: hypothetical protein EYP41_00690 [Anaerolineae bacterium]|nr:hypothetical protein [Anaerolineae bacterium]HIP73078.1 hypothetical protein [Anaerolineae bacterium]